jgi:hemoglobin
MSACAERATPGTIHTRSPNRLFHTLAQSPFHLQAHGEPAQLKEHIEMNQPTTTTLYERLGRREGITRITADLMKNHLANPLVNARYMSSEDLERVERRAVEFFCAGTGGPEAYTGKDMVATHKGMNINEQEFMSVIDDAMDALQKNGIDESTRNEVLAVLWSMRREVLRV